MSHSKIRKAFNDVVREYGTTKGYQVDIENIVATPPTNQPYLKTFILPSSATTNTLGGDNKRYTGVYQISIVIPANLGTGLITQITDELQALFPVYGRVNFDSSDPYSVVTINSPLQIYSGTAQDGVFFTPASFTYRADIN